jgi:hypothetical protein
VDHGQYPADKLQKYPHFFPRDIAIWERFLSSYSTQFRGFDYDIKVGTGTPPVAGLGSEYIRMQAILSKYRIDAVGYTDTAIYIIEVKPAAGTIALGQIELYTRLYVRDYKPTRKVIGMIVTDQELPDMRQVCLERGHAYYIV